MNIRPIVTNCWLAVFLALLLLVPSSAQAESRKGLVIGGGIGPGVVRLEQASRNDTELGLSTDLTVGYGITKQYIVYAMSRIVWFDMAGELTFSETAGAGISYFFEEEVPSLYLTAGIGAAVYVQPASDRENQFGFAGLAGIGYEAYQHWLFEVDLAHGSPGDLTSTALMAKLNYYFY